MSWLCSRGNSAPGADCLDNPLGGFSVAVSPAWLAGSTLRKDDFAVITWDEPSGVFLEDRQRLTGHGSTPTPISTQSNSAIQAEATGYFGHPSFIVPVLSPFTCMSTNGASVENGFSPAPAPGRTMFTEFRTDHNATTNYVRTKLDATSGQSGSGLVNCPGGCSTSGGGEELVGIFVAGWNELGTFRTGGPKWTRFSAFVAAQ